MHTLDAGDPDVLVSGVAEAFAAATGHDPDGVFAAPGRVNLIGEHVDYNGGLCLPMALPHATYAAVGRRDDDLLTVASRQQPEPFRGGLDALGPGRVHGWVAYAAGVVWALREEGWDVPGLDVYVDGTVPLGAGLSSSAALECSVALGVAELVGRAARRRARHPRAGVHARRARGGRRPDRRHGPGGLAASPRPSPRCCSTAATGAGSRSAGTRPPPG